MRDGEKDQVVMRREKQRATPTPLRRWWATRTAGMAERWATDGGCRASLSLLLTALTLAFLGVCLVASVMMAHLIAPQWFAVDDHIATNGLHQSADYPIVPLTPYPAPPDLTPIAVATSAESAPTAIPSPTPVPIASPTPAYFGVPTPPGATVGPAPVCPALTGQPTLTGRSVQDGVVPAPLVGGCPALLVIAAPTQTNAPISGMLTFGTLDPAGCTIYLNGTTDSGGNATLRFTVPGTDCFRGSVTTSGTLTVGGDSSANPSFPAQGG